MSLPLPSLFARALRAAAKANDLPTVDDETQALITSCAADLATLSSRVEALSLFSPNETLEDISTKDLVYLFVPYVRSQIQGRMKAIDRDERLSSLNQAQRFFRVFVDSLINYQIVPEDERELYARKTSTVVDPAQRRELKIKQYQRDKDIKARIEAAQKRRNISRSTSGSSEFDLILSLLPSSEGNGDGESGDDEDDSETSDILREAMLLLLRLAYAQAHSQLESMNMELELLRNAPPSPPEPPRESSDNRRKGKNKEQEDMWKLEAPARRPGQGPLLDSDGKPLQPFVILPAGASERARLQAQVFQPGHRLPTMSIDEYLEIEKQRGKIITGGGPGSENEPTSSEQLAIDAEQDGGLEGEEAAERKRQKDEKWAQFTDANPKGAGNTMNRG
ncbi:hypothetical protein HGRIS_012728 [Hohenbuehelia grisea]|uniref:TAP42-like protein n=1 Tax=Hohenbuehelia grisea TaxID=104357 RepID=A0ABR3IT83_9AGAR